MFMWTSGKLEPLVVRRPIREVPAVAHSHAFFLLARRWRTMSGWAFWPRIGLKALLVEGVRVSLRVAGSGSKTPDEKERESEGERKKDRGRKRQTEGGIAADRGIDTQPPSPKCARRQGTYLPDHTRSSNEAPCVCDVSCETQGTECE